MNVELSSEDCHCMEPVCPDNVNSLLLVPKQTAPAPEIVPATADGIDSINTEFEVDEQLPIETITLKYLLEVVLMAV